MSEASDRTRPPNPARIPLSEILRDPYAMSAGFVGTANLMRRRALPLRNEKGQDTSTGGNRPRRTRNQLPADLMCRQHMWAPIHDTGRRPGQQTPKRPVDAANYGRVENDSGVVVDFTRGYFGVAVRQGNRACAAYRQSRHSPPTRRWVCLACDGISLPRST